MTQRIVVQRGTGQTSRVRDRRVSGSQRIESCTSASESRIGPGVTKAQYIDATMDCMEKGVLNTQYDK